jgi:hypothetical protein
MRKISLFRPPKPEACQAHRYRSRFHVSSFFKELEDFKEQGLYGNGRVFISNRAHFVFDLHQMVDGIEEIALVERSVCIIRS